MDFTNLAEVKIKNSGPTGLFFGLAVDAVSHDDRLRVNAGDTQTVFAPVLGDISFKFLNAFNNESQTGSYEVSIVME